MNVFDEFSRIISHLESHEVKYALVGGVAVALTGSGGLIPAISNR